MKKLAILLLFFIIYKTTFSQIYNKDFFFMAKNPNNSKYKYHGYKIDFGSYPYTKIDSNVQYWDINLKSLANRDATTAQTILSDSIGNIRFYADMYRVWNKEHKMLFNNSDSGEFYYNQCAKQGLLAPVPQNDSLIYYFSFNRGCYYSHWNVSVDYALQMFTINQKLDSGRGGCIEKYKIFNTNIIPCGVLMKHRNGRDYWLVVKRFNTIDYLSYLITPQGIDTVNYVYSSTSQFQFTPNRYNYEGSMKASADGKTIATLVGELEIMDFNDSTGELTNSRLLSDAGLFEFSPNGNKLYMLASGQLTKTIYIYDLKQTTDSALEATKISYPISISGYYQAIQLMPDCRLLLQNWSNHWGTINYPNEDTSTFEYDSMGFYRNPNVLNYDGQPIAHPPSWSLIPKGMKRNSLTSKLACTNDTAFITLKTCSPGIYRWHFGDGDTALTHDSGVVAKHIYKQAGNYNVTVYIKNPCGIDTVYTQVNVVQKPVLLYGNDTAICDYGQPITLQTQTLVGYKYQWNNNDTNTSITTTKAGMYICKANNGFCHIADSVNITRDKPITYSLYKSYIACPNDSVLANISGNGYQGSSFLWSTGSTDTFTYLTQAGLYTLTATRGACSQTDTLTFKNYNVKSLKVLAYATDSIKVSPLYKNYQWYMNGNKLANDTNSWLGIKTAASYSCTAKDQNNCTMMSDTLSINLGLIETEYNTPIYIYPNPTQNILYIETTAPIKTITLLDLKGKQIPITPTNNKTTTQLNLSTLAKGVYILKVNEVYKKVVVE
jgi:hypothetical protein